MVRKTLLVAGILSSFLYAAMTILFALGWDAYSSSSQTISELSAVGAPTRSAWLIPGVAYTVLVVAFGCGVWMSSGRNRALRLVGGLILAYGSLGLIWPFAPMHQREVLASGGATLSDTVHVALGGVTVLLMLLAIGFGAAAFGIRFRIYSIAMLAILSICGALTFAEAPDVGANLPTPWLGVWERINVGVFLVWIVALVVRIWPARDTTVEANRTKTPTSLVHGQVRGGFEPVREAFAGNFAHRRELGGACCVYRRGKNVVDLWGGIRNKQTAEPWEQNTMVVVHSATKGLAAMTLAIAHSRGWLDYDERVSTYWPEFAQQGKERITVRQLLAHQAGLFAINEPVDRSVVADLDRLAVVLARQKPEWEPGTRQAYHGLTLGFYENELLRRIDPRRRSADARYIYARNLEVPSGNAVGTARAIARAYSAFATGGRELGLRQETLDLLAAPAIPAARGFYDECLKGEVRFSLGFMKPSPLWLFGGESSFGSPGSGGSLGFADPEAGIGYAYVTSQAGTTLTGDPRDVALREALDSVLSSSSEMGTWQVA